jgi:CBS domain containing-hemolysin-like protein
MVMFGEILPKSLFRTYPFRLTLRVMPFLITVYFITLPFTWLFSKFTNLFNVVPKEEEQTFKTRAREEMVLIAVEGSKRGTLFESADVFIENILKLKDRKIADMMQPISEIMENPIFTVRQTVGDLKKDLPDSDECIIFDVPGKNPQGYVTVSEIALVDPRRRLREFTKPLKSIEMGISLLAALKQLRDIQQKFLIVTDGPRIVGILDKMDVLKETYGGISSVLGSDAV